MPISKAERDATVTRHAKLTAKAYRDLAATLQSYALVLDAVDGVNSSCPLISMNDFQWAISESALTAVARDRNFFAKSEAALP